MGEEEVTYLVRQPRYLDMPVKQPPVGVGEAGEVVLQVGIPLLQGGVQGVKEADEGVARVSLGIMGKEVVKHVMLAEYPSVLGIEAEDQPHAKHVEGAHGLRLGGVDVLLVESVVDLADDLASVEGHLLLLLQVLIALLHEELQAVVFPAQVLEEDLLRGGVGSLHVVDEELGEVASDDPTGMLGKGQPEDVALRLLVGGEGDAVALRDGRGEALAEGFLLDHDFGGGDVRVDEAGGVKLHLLLEADERLGMLHVKHLPEERQPKRLALPFLIALALPLLSEGTRRRRLLTCGDHDGHEVTGKSWFQRTIDEFFSDLPYLCGGGDTLIGMTRSTLAKEYGKSG